MMNLKNQKGGTFLGFIIGLITGLVIAVIVALLITKTPIPFSGRQDKPENAPVPATATAPSTDPNQALYGNKDTKPATVSATTPAGTTDTTQTNTNMVSPSPAEQQDPIAAAIKQKETATADDKPVYWLQAGAFKNRTDAENMRGNLALLGFESAISEATSNNGKVYRVRLGPYKSSNVNSAHSKLTQNGIKTTITRTR